MAIADTTRDMLELEMPALGRQFVLGGIYDAIKDETVPGHTIWNANALKYVKTTRNDNIKLSIIESDKLTEKFEKLNVNGSLQISILSGKIKLRGSANYIYKKRTSRRQSSVHVRFQYNTAFKELTTEQLDCSNLSYPQLQKMGRIGSATHVVTQIQYGTEAIFTFTKQLNETENEQEVNGQLKIKAEKFIACVKGNANTNGWNSANTVQEIENNIEFQLQGDFKLSPNLETTTTYEEAIEFGKNFLQLSSNSIPKDATDGKPLGIPITVFLYPLVAMIQDAQNAPVVLYEISFTLASECVRIMQKYEEIEDKLYYMLEDPLMKKLGLIPVQKKLKLLQQYLTSFIADLKIKLGKMVVGIRSGKIKVDSFGQLLYRIAEDNFPFNSDRLNRWLNKKHKEICMIKRFQDEIKNQIINQSKVVFFPSQETLQEQMAKYPVELGFEFTFSSLARKETFLELLNPAVNKDLFNEISTTAQNLNDELWCENSLVIGRIRKEIILFTKLINVNCSDEKFAFAVTAPDEYNETCASQFSIIVHQKQKKIVGSDAVLNICLYYPIEEVMDIIYILVEEEITENSNPLLALVKHYDKENLIDVVQLLIQKDIDVNCQNIDGWNAFLFMCRFYQKENLIEFVRLFTENNIDINCKSDGWNALLLVCQNYDKDNLIDIIQLLIEKKIDVNYQNKNGWNALLYMCQHYQKENLIEFVRLFTENNIDINCKSDGWNALLLVCQNYDKDNLIDIFRLLIEKNIDVNCKTSDGFNAFLFLCRYKEKEDLIEFVRLLTDQNIDVNCKLKDGWNSLHLLCSHYEKKNIIDIVRILIAKNIDVNCKTNQDWNALHFVCWHVPKESLVYLVRLLVQHKIDKKGKTTDGFTARSLLLDRFEEHEVNDVLEILDS